VLLVAGNVTEAAEAAGVTRQTVHRWIRSDERFKRALARAERDALAALNRGLLRLSSKAMEALEAALDDPEIATKLRGADVHLKHLLRYAEIVVIEREITRLEREDEELQDATGETY
jgi:AcrR family transcriptional regulator